MTPRQAVVVDGGLIREVITDSVARRRGIVAQDTLDARDRLLTPGLVDAHSHSGMILVDSITPTGGYYGTIEADRRANLVLFDTNPLQDIKAILGGKTVIKDGVIVQR